LVPRFHQASLFALPCILETGVHLRRLVMGQAAAGETATHASTQGSSRAGFTEEEFGQLCKALQPMRDQVGASVDLSNFVSRFPTHLRPLVQPLFFQLAGNFGEPAAAWPMLVEGLSALIHGGKSTWQWLLESWANGPDASGKSNEHTSTEIELFLELAASLCFWCAYPDFLPIANNEESDDHLVATASASGHVELQTMLSCLHACLFSPLSSSIAPYTPPDNVTAAAKQLDANVPLLPRAVGPRFANALINTPMQGVASTLESRILGAGYSLLLRGSVAHLWESGTWTPLYRDWCDGRSFNALLKGTLYYDGPALLVARTKQGEVLGGLSNVWEDRNGKFAGTSECFLFSLAPSFQVLRSSARSGNYVYLNARNKHAARGLGFGGQPGFFRLWLDADFEDCYVLENDATYGTGQLLLGSGMQRRFEPSVVEIWACGSEEAKAAQMTERARVEGIREEARKVDKAKLVENEFDKEMFFQNTFQASGTREQASST